MATDNCTTMTTGGCDEDYPSEGRYVFGLFYGFLSLLIIASNIINLITLPHARASLGANTVLSFQALALVDLLTGIFVTGRNFLEVFCPYISGPSIQATVKRVSTILSVMCMNWSMLILGCVSANRYLVIAKPVTYGIYMTRGKMLASLLVVCLLGAVHAIGGNILSYSQTNPPCYYHVEFCEGISPSFLALYLVVPVLVTVVITFTNIKLLFIVVDHKKRLRRQSMIDMKRCDANPKCESVRKMKGVKTLLIVTLVLYIFYAPAIISDSYSLASGIRLPMTMNEFFTALLFSNSFMNSLVYLGTMRSFRRALKQTFTCRCSTSTKPRYPHLRITYDN